MRAIAEYVTCVFLFAGHVYAVEPATQPLRETGKGVSEQTYRVRCSSSTEIKLDGRLDEEAWRRAAVERHFIFPWKSTAAPRTGFRAICDDQNLYFAFEAKDAD